MIMPTIRASLSRSDARQLAALIGRDDSEMSEAARLRLDEHGVDSLLDDPRVLNGLLTDPDVSVPPTIVFYVLVRQALLEGGIDDRGTADYVASLIAAFGRAKRPYRISARDGSEFHYLTDMISEMQTAGGRRQFLLRVHMGNFALWISGLFPDYLEARTRRRGAPPIAYFEELGAGGYRQASNSREAQELGMDHVLRGVADHFSGVRVALNRISDRHFWPQGGDPVGRLLREVSGRLGG